MPESLRSLAGRYNVLRRHRPPDDPAIADAERDLRAASLADHIGRVVDAAPPLTPAQRERLALLLHPGTGGGADG